MRDWPALRCRAVSLAPFDIQYLAVGIAEGGPIELSGIAEER
jgi:hypothetical protein